MAITFEKALVYKLLNTTAISNIVGTRVYALRFPSTPTLPCIVYKEVSAPIEATHDEAAAGALTHARYQIDAWSADTSTVTGYDGASGLAAAIFTALEGFSGVITKGADSFEVQSALRVDKRTDNDAETGLSFVSQDFMFWFLGG